MPPQIPPQAAPGGPPAAATQGQPQVAPGAQPTNIDPQQIMQLLEVAVQASVDANGFVDIEALVRAWPQAMEQTGVKVPIQVVLEMIQQNPQILQQLIQKLGLNGMIVNGQQISGEQLVQQAGMGGGQQGAAGQPQAAAGLA